MMLSKGIVRASSLAFFLVFSLCGAEANTPKIRQTPLDPQPFYSPTAMAQAQTSIALSGKGYSGPVCVVFTELSRSPALNLPQQSVNYGLFSANGSLQLSVNGSPASAQQTLQGVFANNSPSDARLSLDFLVEVFPTSLPPPGMNTITLRADLYASSYPPSGGIVDSVIFIVSIQVGSYYDVSVVPSGTAFSLSSTTTNLAFGSLQPNESEGADILVRSNIFYNLSLSSANGGAFLNASDGSKLPYSLTANGFPVSLSPEVPALIATGTPTGYGTPTRCALIVTVLPYTKLPTEGTYSDTITVNLSAR